MEVLVLHLEMFAFVRFLTNFIEGDAELALSFVSEVEEVVRRLQLDEVALDVQIVVHVLLELLAPLSALPIEHHGLAVGVVEGEAYLRVLAGLLKHVLCTAGDVEWEPELFDR